MFARKGGYIPGSVVEILTKLFKGLYMFGGAITGVSVPTVFRKVTMKFGHEIVTVNLGDDTREHHMVTLVIPFDKSSDRRVGKLQIAVNNKDCGLGFGDKSFEDLSIGPTHSKLIYF